MEISRFRLVSRRLRVGLLAVSSICTVLVCAGSGRPPTVPTMPDAWRTRTLHVPPGYEMLAPADVFLGFNWQRDDNGWLENQIAVAQTVIVAAPSFKEAQDIFPGTFPGQFRFSGSETLGKVVLGWVAYVWVADWSSPSNPRPIQAAGFAYGGATVEEAVEEAFRSAIAGYRELTKTKPIAIVHVHAGVSTKLDFATYHRVGTATGGSYLPFSVIARFPIEREEAAAYGCLHNFPEDAAELTRYLFAPERRGRIYRGPGGRTDLWWGMSDISYNIPRPNMARPDFTPPLRKAQYRPEATLSDEERRQRDEAFALALELLERAPASAAVAKAAQSLLLDAAKLGHAEAQHRVGMRLLAREASDRKRSLSRDERIAAEKAAHERGREGLAWLEAAVEQGHRGARVAVLEQVLASYGPFVDSRRALELVTQMAEEGDLGRIRDLAHYHRGGHFGLRKDPAKAVAHLQRGLALDPAKLSPAELERQALLKDDLAIAYIRGEGVARDAARGAQLLRESGVEGSVDEEGDIYRGWFYATGEHGFPRNLQKARDLLIDRFSPAKGSRSEKDYEAALAALKAAETSAETPAVP